MITVPLFATSASGHTVKISKTTRQASTGPSTLNNRSTVPTIKTISLYSLPLSFYFWQVFGLLLVGLLFLALSRSEQLDWLISNYWFDPVGQNFPWEHNKWLDLLNHRLLKMALIATAIAALLWGIYRRNGRLVTTALLFGLGPLVIGILKATSAHSCPWDLVEYGGKALNYVLMDTAHRVLALVTVSWWSCFQRFCGHGTVFCFTPNAHGWRCCVGSPVLDWVC